MPRELPADEYYGEIQKEAAGVRTRIENDEYNTLTTSTIEPGDYEAIELEVGSSAETHPWFGEARGMGRMPEDYVAIITEFTRYRPDDTDVPEPACITNEEFSRDDLSVLRSAAFDAFVADICGAYMQNEYGDYTGLNDVDEEPPDDTFDIIQN